MPLQRQVGFIYDSPNLFIIAHELGHGAFNLRHTFSPESFIAAERTTQNLLDYPSTGVTVSLSNCSGQAGTELWKHQWEFIRDPQNIWFAWAQEESKGEMIAVIDTGKFGITITEMNVEFAPSIGEMKLKYKLGDSTKVLMEKYPDEDFLTKMFVFDKSGQKLYESEKEATVSGEFVWDGFFGDNKKDSLVYEKGPFKLSLVLTNVDSSINSWQDFKDWAYEIFSEDSVNTFMTSCDTSFNILTGAHLEWIANKDMQGWVVPSSLEDYKRIQQIYMTYDGVKESGNPFDYIKENTIYVDFLGKKLRVHNEFATVLENVKTTLKNKGVYSALTNKYSSQYVETFAMRTINDPKGGGSVSEHGFAMAIDILPKKNPQILSVNTDDKPYNTYVRFFIKVATGFDVGTSKTVTSIKSAHEKLLNIFSNTTIKALTDEYQAIYTYNNNTENINVNSLEQINNDLNVLKDACLALNDESTSTEVNNVQESLNNYALKIKSLSANIVRYKNTIIFDDIANGQIDDLKIKLGEINSELSNIEKTLNDAMPGTVSFSLIEPSDYDKLKEKITAFNTEQQKLCASLYTFATRLKSGVGSIGFENILLQDGFCDLEIDLINAFLDADDRIQWGGAFNKKVDGMHFGFTTTAAKSIVNKNN